ncbi:uroporphyrinogen-III synthase [Sanguibacter inulinus]|uniref:Uroporphyrinogen-III synthase n=1 Tax=Sanguibacter inulinus TaxID=60922 RepID=A0A853F230_9MICO|nr:uroporphyrinogen-III synthase [Sanguibacter inulinus]MBF0724358.1 uroporphyrinogen-III synthase [Sanguibacter inulinus]NYS95503.1 uroporphyrinogen-III synthase [Sanguibacter inulinus]
MSAAEARAGREVTGLQEAAAAGRDSHDDELQPAGTPTSPALPLDGWRVLIPRAPGRGAGLARLVEQAGGSAVVAPLVSRADIGDDDRAVLDTAVAGLRDGDVAWVAVTSVNAVDELVASAARVDAGPGREPLARIARGTRWAAVGPATARALAAVGITVDLVATENSAVGLLAEWPEVERVTDTAPAPRVLLPLGDLARPTLETGLRERGFAPVRVTTYRTVSHPAPPEVVSAWRDGRFDAVVLTSGSVAREVAGQLGPREDVSVVAIGEPTRRAASETGQEVAAVARTADDDGLLAALVEARGTDRTDSSRRSSHDLGGAPAHP